MAVQISESFQLYAHAPLDSRSQFRTVAEMRSFPTNRLYEGIIASVVENATTYQFFSSNEATEETGKWRIFGATTSPVQKHDRDAVHLVMNIADMDIQPGDNYLYIGSEPYSATGKKLVTGDIFTVNTDGSFTVLFHIGSGNSEPTEPSEPIVPETVADPVITITEGGTATIACSTEDATIYYTTDGTDPSSSSQVYSEEFAVTDGTIVKAIAVKGGVQSSIASKTYTAPAKDYAYYGLLSSYLGTTVHVTDPGITISEATVLALTKKEVTSNAGTLAFVASQANREAPGFSFKVYAYPAKFGELKEYNFGFGVNSISPEFTKFDLKIGEEPYYVYAQETGFRPAKVGATYTYTFD